MSLPSESRLPVPAAARAQGRPSAGGRDTSLGLLAILILLGAILSIVSPYFLTTTNLLNIGRGIAIVGIVAVGETIVIIAGGFDLSVGSTMARLGHGRRLAGDPGRAAAARLRRRASSSASSSASPTGPSSATAGSTR